MVTMDEIKKLRAKTGAGIMDAKRALEEAQRMARGPSTSLRVNKWPMVKIVRKAEELLKKQGLAKAAKKSDRTTKAGLIYSYVHHDGKSGAMVELGCETDFVAKTPEFTQLAQELAMQVCSMDPKDVKSFLKQEYIRDPGKTVEELISETISRTGENIKLERFTRFGLGG